MCVYVGSIVSFRFSVFSFFCCYLCRCRFIAQNVHFHVNSVETPFQAIPIDLLTQIPRVRAQS